MSGKNPRRAAERSRENAVGRRRPAGQRLAVDRAVEVDGLIATAHRPMQGFSPRDLLERHARGQVLLNERFSLPVEEAVPGISYSITIAWQGQVVAMPCCMNSMLKSSAPARSAIA